MQCITANIIQNNDIGKIQMKNTFYGSWLHYYAYTDPSMILVTVGYPKGAQSSRILSPIERNKVRWNRKPNSKVLQLQTKMISTVLKVLSMSPAAAAKTQSRNPAASAKALSRSPAAATKEQSWRKQKCQISSVILLSILQIWIQTIFDSLWP